MDSECIVWFRCYRVPCHAWNSDFFEVFATLFGEFMCIDDATRRKICMDMARIMVRTRNSFVRSKFFCVCINGKCFIIIAVEELSDPGRYVARK